VETVEAIAYAEAVRAIEKQAGMLDELRARTGVVLTASSVAVSFLGAAAFQRKPVPEESWWAVAAFCVVVLMCAFVVFPRSWRFSLGATQLLADWTKQESGGPVPMLAFVAKCHETNFLKNDRQLAWLYAAFVLALAALGAQVVLLTLAIT
jgi:hypothetical protein